VIELSNVTFGFAICGSFCTFSKAIEQMKKIVNTGYSVLPVMSQNAYSTDTRFGLAADFVQEVEEICGKKVIKSIVEAEPIGPKKMVDLMIVAPCTGNTLAKIANGITDTSVTMAVKSTLRIGRPVLITPATNDALAASAQNIGKLMNNKNIFFVPMRQDDPVKKFDYRR
jgi:dipicolinate synthase subunit B